MKKLFFATLACLLSLTLFAQDNPFGSGNASTENTIVKPPKLYVSPFYGYGFTDWDGENERLNEFGANIGWRFIETRPVMLMTGLNYMKYKPSDSKDGRQVLQVPLILKASSFSVKRKSGMTAELGVTASFLLNADDLNFPESAYEYSKSYIGGLSGIGYRFDVGRTGLELFCRYQSSWTKAGTSHYKVWSGGDEESESLRNKSFTLGIVAHIPIL